MTPSVFDHLELQALQHKRSTKWSHYPTDVLPAWVADLDFALAPPIHAALERAIRTSDLGYPPFAGPLASELGEIFSERCYQRHQWNVDPSTVLPLVDVMQGIYIALHTCVDKGAGVIVQPPVYPPFFQSVAESSHHKLENPLLTSAKGYDIDFEQLDSILNSTPTAKVLLLCNPQNPTGRVFTRQELENLAQRVLANNLLVLADEIHSDLIYHPHRHIPFASLGKEIARQTITFTSSSKAFNTAGLKCAVAVFGSSQWQQRFMSMPAPIRSGPSVPGLLASTAAWRHGDPWLGELLNYLDGNREWLQGALQRIMPQAAPISPEGSFLAWIDCRPLQLKPSPYEFFLQHARVALADGAAFGSQGAGFVRLNFGTSRPILQDIVGRLDGALQQHR